MYENSRINLFLLKLTENSKQKTKFDKLYGTVGYLVYDRKIGSVYDRNAVYVPKILVSSWIARITGTYIETTENFSLSKKLRSDSF